MKAHKLELKTVPCEDPVTGDKSELAYSDALKMALARGGSLNGDGVIKAMEIVADLKKANGALYLSPENHRFVCDRVRETPWLSPSEALGGFIKDVRAAELVDVGE